MRAWTFSSTRRGSSLTCPPGAAAFALAKEEMAVRLGVGGRLVGVGVGVIWGWVGGRWEWVWVECVHLPAYLLKQQMYDNLTSVAIHF